MGMVIIKALFEGGAPGLSRIAEALAARSGLEVAGPIRKDNGAPCHKASGWVAFACDPKRRIDIHVEADVPAMMMQDMEESLREYAPELIRTSQMATMASGEPTGKQAVYLTDHAGQNPALLHYLMLTLEDLGGRFIHPLGEAERKNCAQPLTPLELQRRNLKSDAAFLAVLFLGALFLPYTVAFGRSNIDSSRGRLNALMRQAHARFGEPGDPPQMGRFEHLRMNAWMVAMRCLAAIPAVLIGLVGVVLIPFGFVFVLAKYALLMLKQARGE